ncbi:MAG: DUF2225 domain-containing protein [Clostridiaceae bacterium]|jgi:uncharacterized protein (DUF2225 family)|nr:DUF2225 domain-containing protein [Clostridiaceae bacterium]
MNEFLYSKEIECPVCLHKISVTKVKSRGCKVQKRDSDFCVHYETINPLFYDAWVCKHCGYAAQSDKFSNISYKECDVLKEKLMPKWKGRSFEGERTIDDALEAFKLILISHQIRGVNASELAKVCMRIAWLYRFKGNEEEKELEFVEYALKFYSQTYETESFPADKLDENTCTYMIAELNFRAGNYEESVKWFSRLIGSAEARKNPVLMETARDQFQLVKEKLKK